MFQRALITGASSGIGKEFAMQLAQRGVSCVLVARREHELRDLALHLPGEHQILVADLSQQEGVEKVCRLLKEDPVELLINNAGVGKYGLFDELPLQEHLSCMHLNMDALVSLSHCFLRTAKHGDALVNISSILSRLTYPGGAVYAGTKGFVTIFSESLWYEYREKGVYVMALLPGATRTSFHGIATGGHRASKKERAMSYSAKQVVAAALTTLNKRRRPSFVTGRRFYWLSQVFSRFMPRAGMIAFMGRLSPGMRKSD